MRKQPNSYDCVVCGVRNDAGIKAAFYDTVSEGGQAEVLVRFTARSNHQGYPGRVHGGLAAGILDEAICRAINAGNAEGDATVWGVAVDLSTRFLQPVPLDVALTARGRITRDRRRLFEGSAEIYLPDGSVAVTAEGRYARLRLDRIADVDNEALGWRVYADETETP
ncbi:MAG: PaaI family thioesterase [bacterium]|nr:PaaI family thioesterase [bacterium]